jgi:hypothetical protein
MRFSILSIFVTLCLTLKSCGLGSDEPEHLAVTITPDGSKVIRMFNVFTCTSYKSGGGFEHRGGFYTTYLDIFDAKTGNKITKESYKTENSCEILTASNNLLWLRQWNLDLSRFDVKALRLPDFTEVETTESLQKKNNLMLSGNEAYVSPSGQNGIALKADDARVYFIDDATRKATILPDSLVKTKKEENFEFNTYLDFKNTDTSVIISFIGLTRKKLQKVCSWYSDTSFTLRATPNTNIKKIIKSSMQKKAIITSSEDFIEPYFLLENTPAPLKKHFKIKAYTFKNNYIVLSKSKSSALFKWQINTINSGNLKTQWHATLENNAQKPTTQNLIHYRIFEGKLVMVTDVSISMLDLETGNWKWQVFF